MLVLHVLYTLYGKNTCLNNAERARRTKEMRTYPNEERSE
nr:MAG TPA: hypothetical protein [Caudoviricetes sp.]